MTKGPSVWCFGKYNLTPRIVGYRGVNLEILNTDLIEFMFYLKGLNKRKNSAVWRSLSQI